MNGIDAYLRPFWMYQLVYVPFVFALGAIVGSFLNVVIFRLPARQNIISPPSHCPVCNERLRWYENLPVVGWIRLRGRCGHCGAPISIQYPLIEALCGTVFTLIFVLGYMVLPTAPFIGELLPAYLGRFPGLSATWPIPLLYCILFSALLAMTMIDLRTYTIPIELTWAVTLPALLVHAIMPIWPGGSLRLPLSQMPAGADGFDLGAWTIPLVGPAGLAAALGGALGIVISTALIRLNQLRYSFLDFDLYVKENDEIIDYPHPRRELEWELDFLGPIVLGVLLGLKIGSHWAGVSLPLWAGSLGGSLMGYLVGAGLIWLFRLAGTVAFGKEAMGLGDAHMLACVGAVLGWVDPILVFFLAPFLAILGMLIGTALSRWLKGFARYIPYGPWIALAAVVVIIGDRWIEIVLEAILKVPVNLP
ncbi:MAG: prepilin peptidase [Phycisphaerales bacterium]|nr:prepilin peptidase [Phycisphaerales bacterium]